jgi:hypothetical protein
MVLPHIGRMDDIWMSYMIEKIFPNSVIYNSSSVYQDRNEQDLITNLKNEMDGYRNTLNFIQDKYQLNDLAQTAYELYKEQF